MQEQAPIQKVSGIPFRQGEQVLYYDYVEGWVPAMFDALYEEWNTAGIEPVQRQLIGATLSVTGEQKWGFDDQIRKYQGGAAT